MSKAVREARNEMRSRTKKLSAALKKIGIWKKKAAQLDRMKKKKSKKKSRKKRRGHR